MLVSSSCGVEDDSVPRSRLEVGGLEVGGDGKRIGDLREARDAQGSDGVLQNAPVLGEVRYEPDPAQEVEGGDGGEIGFSEMLEDELLRGLLRTPEPGGVGERLVEEEKKTASGRGGLPDLVLTLRGSGIDVAEGNDLDRPAVLLDAEVLRAEAGHGAAVAAGHEHRNLDEGHVRAEEEGRFLIRGLRRR